MADWNTRDNTSAHVTRGSAGRGGTGRRKHWKLPDMIQGVRHRFRDKRRSKSPDYSLDDCVNKNTSNGGHVLPRASSMMSTDYGFSAADWGGTCSSTQPRVSMDGYIGQSGANDRVPPIIRHSAVLPSYGRNVQSGSGLDNGVMSDCDIVTNSTLSSSRLTSSSSSTRGTAPTIGVGRAASVSAVNQVGGSNSIQRGKSIRFGENRISVFLQDSTQALEECVRLALSYAEESKRGGEYASDSEAVTLSRSLNQEYPHQSLDNKNGSFWSDSENHAGGGKNKSALKHYSSSSQPSCSRDYPQEGPPTPTNYKPRSFGQAVNSLDRVERLDKFHHDRSRKKRSAQINEIFSFIDKILSGCDSGCNDERCPFVRESGRVGGGGSSRLPPTDWSTTQHRYNNSSSIPSEYQSKKSSSFPRSDTASYAAIDQLRDPRRKTGGSGSMVGAGAGWASDSDCDTSECSTLVDRRHRPPRSRLRPGSGSDRAAADDLRLGSNKRTTEDVFAQIIICCESNKESLGMPKYRHIHQKISQTVCNAIFLCKVTTK